ncbi:hypothetical protein UPYG_G00045370 [Umbra pygmaea]|uniref:Uncharacterized protein n=1 Tax=Umbra pygmaea TaxID=75934 RepID=A0ABD0Y9L2_UMBPY
MALLSGTAEIVASPPSLEPPVAVEEEAPPTSPEPPALAPWPVLAAPPALTKPAATPLRLRSFQVVGFAVLWFSNTVQGDEVFLVVKG